jgi:hypothetical protein
MAINLEDNSYFEFEKKIRVVPLSIALEALEEQQKSYENFDRLEEKLNKSISLLNSNMEGINPLIDKIND